MGQPDILVTLLAVSILNFLYIAVCTEGSIEVVIENNEGHISNRAQNSSHIEEKKENGLGTINKRHFLKLLNFWVDYKSR